MSHSELVYLKVQELKRKANNKKITWEAEVLILFESIDINNVLIDFRKSSNFDLERYNLIFINKYKTWKNTSDLEEKTKDGILNDLYQSKIFPLLQPIYAERLAWLKACEEERKRKQQEEAHRIEQERLQKIREELEAKKRRKEEEDKRYREYLESEFKKLKERSKETGEIFYGVPDTFDFSKAKSFYYFSKLSDGNWVLYGFNSNTFHNRNPLELVDWFEQGKVPFCTKCPVCKGRTQLNYLDYNQHNGGLNAYNTSHQSIMFTEVFCPSNHYFYDCITNKHYVSGGKLYIQVKRIDNCSNQTYTCWNPSKLLWKEWDPSDPDGSKQKEREKQMERENILASIVALQEKLKKI